MIFFPKEKVWTRNKNEGKATQISICGDKGGASERSLCELGTTVLVGEWTGVWEELLETEHRALVCSGSHRVFKSQRLMTRQQSVERSINLRDSKKVKWQYNFLRNALQKMPKRSLEWPILLIWITGLMVMLFSLVRKKKRAGNEVD